ncbi:transcriptional regulator [uncultured Methanobrevibacter sp.]|uniref:transcriptional regulator n=1 Tax=uncultured Methanobrevibacter sp. TaxID=253161 RepID=UPI002615D156|nr:transcriptional regulator [uncultured Methanobrevibacter sp.]
MSESELSDEILTDISFVLISKYRTRVMKALNGGIKIPSQLARECDILTNHISLTLKQLMGHDLVECINPEVRKGRLYRLTEKGQIVVKNL